jgi:hypothetical protein
LGFFASPKFPPPPMSVNFSPPPWINFSPPPFFTVAWYL